MRMLSTGWSPLPCRRIVAGSRLRRSFDDRAGNRLDPDEVILNGPDPRHILGSDAQRRAFLLVEDDAIEIDDPVLDGDRDAVARHPGGLRQLDENAFADLLVARRRSRLFFERAGERAQ